MERSKMDQKAQHLLSREIQAMEELHHPNIIRLFECVETMTRTFLVMEYAGGGELYGYIRERGKLPEQDCKPLFSQIVAAVAHMHTRKLVHRDIKAENVIFSRPGQIKLADFGFSCKLEEDGKLRTFCGSPPYAAPELFKEEKYYGPMVDIWAMGVLLFFMLVGNTPFRGDTISDLRQNILKGFFDLPDYLSSFAQLIITRMLEMNPEKRMTVFDIKCKTHHTSKNPDKNAIVQAVWHDLSQYGITEEMLAESYPKAPRSAVVGTYRIVLYQTQIKAEEEERQRAMMEQEQNEFEVTKKKVTPMLNHRNSVMRSMQFLNACIDREQEGWIICHM
ncbi:unnamed protein product [Enterobius vermicularis]|uniref:Protein kinase domain-containing protein n=1 Tax=Enterobius vermicularis TaxID=51028 RepID=A0A0N4VFI7_ENTVE|nr:unnamed protein product [Enterobius vermicularis]